MPTYTIANKLNYKEENEEKKKVVDAIAERIEKEMSARGFEQNRMRPNYVFSVGGDGTMMHSMHTYFDRESIIVGINAGNVGFLTPFECSDLDMVFELIDNPKALPFLKQIFLLTHTSIAFLPLPFLCE